MTVTPTLKRTALFDAHRSLGAKMVPFAGWEMPVQYPTGILAEHHAVRTGAGVFDVSHMGELEITGPDRNAFVNRVTCNDVGALGVGQVQYSAILTREGTFVDDCTVYRFEDKLMIVVNASNTAKAWEHIVEQKGGINVRLKDISNDVGLLSVQGPQAESLIQPLSRTRLSDIVYYHFTTGQVAGAECFISRTGYTGEDGFELYCRERDTVKVWEAIIGAGAKPIGLGARDSLRTEMGYALYGNEIDDTITPLEAGLGWIVKLDKGSPFMGDAALQSQKRRGVTRKLVGFQLQGRGFPRHGYPVHHEGREVDLVRSGTMSPSLGLPIGTTYLPAAAAKVGTRFEVECRGERMAAEVVSRPFWKKGSARKAGQTGSGAAGQQ
jgi:aminomethyltransferase